MGPLTDRPWRVVETQYRLATQELVDDPDEQVLLERLIDGVKPAVPRDPGFDHLHRLLSTPFRYPPPPGGSRFGPRPQRGIWYGAQQPTTALAEKAYHLLRARGVSDTRFESEWQALTLFQVKVQTERGIDLTRPPFHDHTERISSPRSYRDAQPLGLAMRQAEFAAFRFRSARCPAGGSNLGVLNPQAFAERSPSREQAWRCLIAWGRVQFYRGDPPQPEHHVYSQADFEIDGELPRPGLV